MTQDSGTPIPQNVDLKKLSQQELIDRLMHANYQIQEANRNADRRVNEEKLRSQQDLDRLRNSNSQHIRDLENQNKALLRSLTWQQADMDKLQEEIVTLRIKLSNGNGLHRAEDRPSEPIQPGANVAIATTPPPLSGEAIPRQQPKAQ